MPTPHLADPRALWITLEALTILGAPAVTLRVARMRGMGWLSPVIACYLIGMLWANLPGLDVDEPFTHSVAELCIPLAIPLLLLSTDVRGWLRHGRPAAVSFGLAALSVCIHATWLGVLLSSSTAEAWKAAGMMVGVYTGGTPNLLSIGLAVQAREETTVLLNASDALVCGIYLLCLLTLGRRVFGWFLAPFKRDDEGAQPAQSEEDVSDSEGEQLPWRARLRGAGAGLLLSLALTGMSVGGTALVLGELHPAPILLGLTTGGVAASLVRRLRELPGTYELGNYLILMFCISIGALTDLGRLASASSVLLVFCAATVVLSVVTHLLLAKLAGVDRDTFMITSTAAIFGPPFVIPVARALDNRSLILSGLTTGLVGYAVGNYLGLGIAYLVRALAASLH